jgi:uncharacterized SAM-binding protein YcdF (DUF218 family)
VPSTPPSSARVSSKLRRWLRRLGWLLIFGGALLYVCYVFRAPLLTGLAETWAVNEPAAKADAIVILGGGLENRPFAAAKLFHEGVAPLILFINVKPGPAEELGVVPTETEQTQRILLGKNVPASAMLAIGTNVASTFDESRAVRAWIEKTGASTIVITTDLFHTRRARWIFRRELRDLPVKIGIVAVDPVRYKINNWWRNEEGLIQFQNEIIKSLYYHVRY